MRRYLDWLGGALWGVAVYRLWRRWRGEEEAEPAPEPATVEESDDPAEELRAKLAETRAADEAPTPEEPPQPETLDERRRRVHDEGRAALDEMRGD
ncbi:MAG: hypothetical protein ACRDLM_11800 [Gaiellaceae bacterium]